MSDGFLHKIFLNNNGRLIHKWAHYFDIYERHFSRFRNKAPTVLEIGVYKGGSLAMWKEFFGEDSKIIGVDIDPTCAQYNTDGIDVYIGSQDDPDFIEEILRKHPHIDIVIDDGSHIMLHMINTFNMLYNRINPNGIYLIEDTHTCYWSEFGGGVRNSSSFMEFAKDRIDELNAVHTRGIISVSDFTRSTDYISFYDSVVVFERRPQGERQDIKTQKMI